MATPIVLFDIDLTLIRTGGAGQRAMNRAALDLYGRDGLFDKLEFAGRTDPAIIRDALQGRLGLDGRWPHEYPRFLSRYLALLEEELTRSAGVTLPGVISLLEALRADGTVRLGLATGNVRAGARLKLRAHALWDRFEDGGFADDSEDRAVLTRVARRRLGGGPAVVVGDSVHDVTAGHAAGARVLAVATGGHSVVALAEAGADSVLPDLGDVERSCGELWRLLGAS